MTWCCCRRSSPAYVRVSNGHGVMKPAPCRWSGSLSSSASSPSPAWSWRSWSNGPRRRPTRSPSPDGAGRMHQHRRHALHGERGALAVELAVVFPVVLLLVWIGFQLAFVFLANRVALAADEEGARSARG